MDPISGNLHVSSNLAEVAACIITDLIFVNNASADLSAYQCQWLDLLEESIQTVFCIVHSLVTAVSFDLPCIFQKLTDTQKLSASERGTDFQTL